MRRHLRDQEIAIRKELKKYEKMRVEHRKARARKNLPTVGIVGYTNAGKSHLSHALTKKDILVADKLFATLTTSVGKMTLCAHEKWHDVLVNDTIGFIRDLPPDLIEAFSSTLEESVQSDILLQVIDGSDPAFERKLQVVNETLASIGATQPRIIVVNKMDAMSDYRKRIVRKFFK